MNDAQYEARLEAMGSALSRAQRALADLSRELEEARAEAKENRSRTHYSLDEAATALGVSRSTIKRRLMDGTLCSAKVGGRRLIPAMELELAGVA